MLNKVEAREGPKRIGNKLLVTAVLRDHLQHLNAKLV